MNGGMARRESVKYSLQYVLSALDELGLDDDDSDSARSLASPVVADFQSVVKTLKAIGDAGEFEMNCGTQSASYNLQSILQSLETLGEEESSDINSEFSRGLSSKQLTAKHDLEDMVLSLSALEQAGSRKDPDMKVSQRDSENHSKGSGGGSGGNLHFVMQSLSELGEDEDETQNFLHNLNPANKNAIVKVNLQYVLSLLNKLSENDSSPVPAAVDNTWKSESKNSERESQKFPPQSARRHSQAVNSIGSLDMKEDMTLTQFLKSECKGSSGSEKHPKIVENYRGESKQSNHSNNSDDKHSNNNRK